MFSCRFLCSSLKGFLQKRYTNPLEYLLQDKGEKKYLQCVSKMHSSYTITNVNLRLAKHHEIIYELKKILYLCVHYRTVGYQTSSPPHRKGRRYRKFENKLLRKQQSRHMKIVIIYNFHQIIFVITLRAVTNIVQTVWGEVKIRTRFQIENWKENNTCEARLVSKGNVKVS